MILKTTSKISNNERFIEPMKIRNPIIEFKKIY